MTPTFHALWMLCALGTVVWAAAALDVARRAAFAAGFATAALLTSGSYLPDAVWTGGVAAMAAALYLFKPQLRVASVVIGGALGGSWTALLEAQGLPVPLALVAAAAVVLVSIWLSQSRPWFAPEVMREEGLLAIGVLGLAVAVMPGVLDGWQAARNLSGASERVSNPAVIPMWTVALVLGSLSLGGLYSVWSRR